MEWSVVADDREQMIRIYKKNEACRVTAVVFALYLIGF